MLTTQEDIERHLLIYFTAIFSAHAEYIDNDLPDLYIPHSVTSADNVLLTALPSAEEIKHDVFDLSGDAAPGPDGFPGHFYQHFWHIIGTDVVKSTRYFFQHNYIMPNMNSNLLILIPKVPGADRLDNFRPIALANFQFKLITKILADRLGTISKSGSNHTPLLLSNLYISSLLITTFETSLFLSIFPFLFCLYIFVFSHL
jgi:hypothetical protein